VCAYTNQGIGYALSNYFYNYVWQFNGTALKILPFALFLGAGLAFVVAPRVGRLTTKPRAACGFVLGSAVFQTMPYWLRFLGAMPPIGSPALIPSLFAIFVVGTMLSVSSFILGASMMADVVEDSQMRTGRRNEGVFFAGSFFVQKCTSGIGIAAAGLMLWLAAFPAAAKVGQVPVAAVDRLTLLYIVTYATLAVIAAIMFTRFPFGRAEHDARLATISAAAEREGAPHTP
jgi:GPH family glycoside/pentoside/hexuronide:cation symporter